MTNEVKAALTKLVAKWRDEATHNGVATGNLLGCADELEAELAALPEQREPTLEWLQANLPWTIPYSDEFEASAAINPERRISHDVLHVMKSLGRIAAACESVDHAREPKPIEWPKEVADLVICALHIARLKGFSLEDAVIDCSSLRNGVSLRSSLAAPVSKEPGEAPKGPRMLPCKQCGAQYDKDPCLFPKDCHCQRQMTSAPAALSAPLPEARGAEEAAREIQWQALNNLLGETMIGELTLEQVNAIEKYLVIPLLVRDKVIGVVLGRLVDTARQHMQHSPGWVMVPREPTDEQLIKMFRAFHEDKPEILEEVYDMSDLSDIQAKHLHDGYVAAIAAAPDSAGKQ